MAANLSRRPAAGLEGRRIPWLLVLAGIVAAANVAAAVMTLSGQ